MEDKARQSNKGKNPGRQPKGKNNYNNSRNPGKQTGKPRGNRSPYVSVVIPVYNEDMSINELSRELDQTLKGLTKGNYEVIYIDDGSTDNTYDEIKKVNNKNNRFKAIRFRRNFGKSAALAAGFNIARGNFVATMDGDLQDDPKELAPMLQRLKEGYDLVSGWKKKRKDPWEKKLPSKFFNFVTSLSSGLKLHDFNCGLKMYRKEVIKSIHVYGEMHRYIPALAHWEGFRVTEMPVNHRERKYGKTKFGFKRYINGFLDLMTVMLTTKYLKRPLHFFGTIGAVMTLIGLIINITLTVQWFLGHTYLSDRPLNLLGVALIIVGIQFISTGLLGEMMTKNALKNAKDSYSIKERL